MLYFFLLFQQRKKFYAIVGISEGIEDLGKEHESLSELTEKIENAIKNENLDVMSKSVSQMLEALRTTSDLKASDTDSSKI